MHTIEIDFDVFKALTNRRTTEEVTYNQVLRDLLGLPSSTAQPTTVVGSTPTGSGEWVAKGVRFPAGTEFRATHKGRTVTGKVAGGALCIDGKSYESPSAAAMAITGNPVNGWVFWECRLPGQAWRIIKSMRPNS